MDTKKVIAEAAYGIRKIAFQVVGHVDCLRSNPSYTGNLVTNSEVLLELGLVDANVQSKISQFRLGGSYAISPIVNNARDITKRFMPHGHVEIQINRSGYPVQAWVDAPHITELYAIRSSYDLLIVKRIWEASWVHGREMIYGGWGHSREMIYASECAPDLVLIACSICGKATYNRGHSEPEGSLCFACLSLHLNRVLYLNYGLSAQS